MAMLITIIQRGGERMLALFAPRKYTPLVHALAASGKPQQTGARSSSTFARPQTTWVEANLARLEDIEAQHLHPQLDRIYTICTNFLQPFTPRQNNASRRDLFIQIFATAPQAEISPEEQKANRALVYATSILAFNTFGKLFYPPLMLLSAPLFLRMSVPFLEKAMQEWNDQRKIGTSALDVAISIGMIATGAFWTNALFHLFFACSHKVQLKTRHQMEQSLVNILGETPRFVWVEKDGVEATLPIEQVQRGDVIIAHAGEILAVDGIIVAGFATMDQHSLTGEAQPVEKTQGDTVYAGTLILSGAIRIQVEKSGVATVAGQVGEILRHTADYHATLTLQGQRLADQSVIPSLVVSALTLATIGPAAATATIICSIGYQMKFTGPLSVLNFLNLAAAAGILIKDGRALEQIAKIDMVIFDKTGTLTQEQPVLAQIHPIAGFDDNDVLRLAAAAEAKQNHPLARAILAEAKRRGLVVPASAEAAYVVGYGLRVTIEQMVVQVGSARFMQQEGIVLPERVQILQAACHAQGHALVYVAQAGGLIGLLELHTAIRPEAQRVLDALRQRGLTLAILSGDHEQPTRRLAHALGINHYFAETLPGDKAKVIEQLQQQGKRVCFVGDGINDALALKKANVSVSLRGATTMALDTAQIILRDENLGALTELFVLADRFQTNMKVNFLASTVPGIFSLAGVYLLHFSIFAASCFAWSGLAIGMTNTILPLWQHNQASIKHTDD